MVADMYKRGDYLNISQTTSRNGRLLTVNELTLKFPY